MRQKKHETFDMWWADLLVLAEANDFAVSKLCQEDFRAYYDDGMTPLDALIESRFG